MLYHEQCDIMDRKQRNANKEEGAKYMVTNEALTQNYKHKHKEHLCFHCNELKNHGELIKHSISGRDYLSDFDSMTFEVQLCKECYEALGVEPEWFDNEKSYDKVTGQWHNESYLHNLFELFPICNQEYVYNCANSLCPPDLEMSRETWIRSQEEA